MKASKRQTESVPAQSKSISYVGLPPNLVALSEQIGSMGGHDDAFVANMLQVVGISPFGQKPIPGTDDACIAWCEDERQLILCDPQKVQTKSSASSTRKFVVTKAFPSNIQALDLQHEISDLMLPLQLDGFNSTLVLMGAVGSGKTTTLFGRYPHQGVIQHYLTELFQELVNVDEDTLMTLSVWEIQGESLRDLLRSSGNGSDESACNEGSDPINVTCKNIQQALQALSNAKWQSENWHQNESHLLRGHTKAHMFIRVRLFRIGELETTLGTAHFVDLAGFQSLTCDTTSSLRGVTSTERKVIHRELLNFSRTITELSQVQKGQEDAEHYTLETIRQAKQTRLMRCLTPIIIENVRPIMFALLQNHPDHYLDNLNAMRLVTRAGHIRCACVRQTVDGDQLPFDVHPIDHVLTLKQLGLERAIHKNDDTSSATDAGHQHQSVLDTIYQHGSATDAIHQLGSATDAIHQHGSVTDTVHQHRAVPNEVHHQGSATDVIHQHGSATDAIHQHGSATDDEQMNLQFNKNAIRSESNHCVSPTIPPTPGGSLGLDSKLHRHEMLVYENEPESQNFENLNVDQVLKWVESSADRIQNRAAIPVFETHDPSQQSTPSATTSNTMDDSEQDSEHQNITKQILSLRAEIDSLIGPTIAAGSHTSAQEIPIRLERHDVDWGNSSAEGRHTILRATSQQRAERAKKQLGIDLNSGAMVDENASSSAYNRSEHSGVKSSTGSACATEPKLRKTVQSTASTSIVDDEVQVDEEPKSEHYNALLHTFVQAQSDNATLQQHLEHLSQTLKENRAQYNETEQLVKKQNLLLQRSFESILQQSTDGNENTRISKEFLNSVSPFLERCTSEAELIQKLLLASQRRIKQITNQAQTILKESTKPLIPETVALLAARVKHLRAFVSEMSAKCKELNTTSSQSQSQSRFKATLESRLFELEQTDARVEREIAECEIAISNLSGEVYDRESQVLQLEESEFELRQSRSELSRDTLQMRQFLAGKVATNTRKKAIEVLQKTLGKSQSINLGRVVNKDNTDYGKTHKTLKILCRSLPQQVEILELLGTMFVNFEQLIADAFEREAEAVWAMRQLDESSDAA